MIQDDRLELAVDHTPSPLLAPTPAAPTPTPPTVPPTPTAVETVSPVEPVDLAWFYKRPDDEMLEPLWQHFDTFILSKSDGEQVWDTLRVQEGESGLLYLRFDVIHNPGSCDEAPLNNQVADRVGDFCWISEHHPDWFLLDTEGGRIAQDDGDTMMDPGHPGWRAFWLERVRESQDELGWDGVFIDNVEASLAKREQRGQMPAAYPNDAGYQAAVEGFLAYIHQNYFGPQQRPLYANIIAVRDPAVWFRYLNYLDGAMEEAFAVDWLDGYLAPGEWEQQLRRAERTQALNKHIILVSQGRQDDVERQRFAFASYLLISSGSASFRYTHHSSYREVWLYGSYNLELGPPLGPRYQQGAAWRRDFARGAVEVDPAAHTAEIIVHR